MKVLLVIILGIITITPAFGQLAVGPAASQKNVEITIQNDGTVDVIHEVRGDDIMRSLDLIPGKISNLTVTDEDGNEIQFGISETEKVTKLTLFPNDQNIFVKYDLKPELKFVDGMWRWKFLYLQSTKFNLPEEAELIFVNDRPVLRQDGESIQCHGCQMRLEYAIN